MNNLRQGNPLFTLLDTMMTNRYVECGEVFARIPRGGPGSIVLLWALLH